MPISPADENDPAATVGVDLGTTRSVLSYLDEFGKPRTLVNSEGDLATPSAVLFEGGRVVVGREAIRAIVDSADCVAQYAKRDLGKPDFHMTFEGVDYPPEMIQSLVLGKLRRDAEQRLDRPVTSVVLTVPAFFDEPRRRASIDAGLLAGLRVKAIINEPTAAALAFGSQRGLLAGDGSFSKPEVMFVYDLGGGTFDASILRIEGKLVEVIAVGGNARLGGIDWDKCIVDWLSDQFRSLHGVRSEDLDEERANLMRQAEELKHSLSVRKSVKVRARVAQSMLQTELTRGAFDDLTAHLLDRTRFTTRKLLADAGISWGDIDRVLLVGGSTRMPQVPAMLEREFGALVDRSSSPDEAVAHGAAVYAGIIDAATGGETQENPITISDVNAHDMGVIGVEPGTGRRVRHIMIPKNSPLPQAQSSRFETVRENQRSVLVRVIEGGDASGRYATVIGKFVVYDLPSSLPVGSPVDVYFRYDRDGIIDVSATVPATGGRASIRIERVSGLGAAERDEWRDRTKEILDALDLD